MFTACGNCGTCSEVSTLMIKFFGPVHIFKTSFQVLQQGGKTNGKLVISLKGHRKTCWYVREEAVLPYPEQLKVFYKVSNDVIDDSSCNAETVAGERDIAKETDSSFLCLLDRWRQVLSLIDE